MNNLTEWAKAPIKILDEELEGVNIKDVEHGLKYKIRLLDSALKSWPNPLSFQAEVE